MDLVQPPFAPGAGSPPPELAGREAVLEQARIAVARIRQGNPAKSLILVGLRGVGKTVLLVRIREMAEQSGYKAVIVEAHEGKRMAELLIPSLRQVLLQLDVIANARDKARRALRVLKSFVNGLKFSMGEIHLELGISAETGTGDSGDFEADLGELFIALGEAARAGNTAISLCIDELQYLNETEFSALIMAIHKTNQLRLPLVLVGAGLPQILGLAGASKSYSERLFDFPRVGALSEQDAKAALRLPVELMQVRFTGQALNEILRVTECYPYFLQQWGHESWNLATISPITEDIVKRATDHLLAR
jgi:hypothetical protein